MYGTVGLLDTFSPFYLVCLMKGGELGQQTKQWFTHTLKVTNEDIVTWIHQRKMGECVNRFGEMIVGSPNSAISSKFLYFGIMRSAR